MRKVTTDGDRFVLRWTEPNTREGKSTWKDILDDVKELPDREFDDDSKTWIVPAYPHKNTEKVMEVVYEWDFQYGRDVKQLLKEVAKKTDTAVRASEAVEADEEVEVGGLEPSLDLHPYQRAGVSYLASMERALLADGMGLGKTVSSLATVQYKDAWPAVVVCPAILKDTWANEVQMWLPGLRGEGWPERLDSESIAVIDGFDRASNLRELSKDELKLAICNYYVLDHWADVLRIIEPGAVIFDECHYIKSPDTQRTKGAQRLVEGVDVRLGLSGTPMPNRARELVPQLQVLGIIDRLGGISRFLNEYMEGGGHFATHGEDAEDPKKLYRDLRANGFIRRTKEDILDELPPKQRSTVIVELEARREYEQAVARIVDTIQGRGDETDVGSFSTPLGINDYARLRRIIGEQKVPAAKAWLDDFRKNEEKALVFGWHQGVIEQLADHLGVEPLHGPTPKSYRGDIIDGFKNGDDQFLVGNMEVAGMGLNLPEAHHIIFTELSWVPGTHDQCEDRAHRISDLHKVNSWFLIAKDTIDARVHQVLEAKRQNIDAVIEGEEVGEDVVLEEVTEGLLEEVR